MNMLETTDQPKNVYAPQVSHKLRAKRESRRKTINSLNLNRVKECAALGMTRAEIADRLHVTEDWLNHAKAKDPDLDEALTDGFGDFKESLRRTQAKLALSGHPGMLIWLGKQFLGQTDKQETKQETSVNVTLNRAVQELRDMSADDVLRIQAILEEKREPMLIEQAPLSDGS